ncbi:MAG: hypothetical protein K1X68_03800 [Saprospiraceae bacterium]|nr:hypothetical protein [Saprospiraceae bacterium]MBX7175873.1 hypothetical protein [Saprospiraceae bacterium]HMW40462.1 hypothetical protein [Saprospiraceae bacterium]HMX88864.1 hypothetical protein [Saprospiraceae bacterium]HMZ41007.1 hypothetical protein [Saprospiraceae bacterium]
MIEPMDLFHKIGYSLTDAEPGSLFGKPCYKIHGKAFICFFQNEMVFKLSGQAHQEAIELNGSRLFDPSGEKRPMKEWVQVSFENSARWKKLAESAAKYIVSK